MYIYICIYKYVYIYIQIKCIYIYICIQITCIYKYIYIYMHKLTSLSYHYTLLISETRTWSIISRRSGSTTPSHAVHQRHLLKNTDIFWTKSWHRFWMVHGWFLVLVVVNRISFYIDWLVVEPYPSEKYEFVNFDDYSQY